MFTMTRIIQSTRIIPEWMGIYLRPSLFFSFAFSLLRLVYINKHTQPSTDTCMAGLLKSPYGQVDASFLIQVTSPWFCFFDGIFFFSFFFFFFFPFFFSPPPLFFFFF